MSHQTDHLQNSYVIYLIVEISEKTSDNDSERKFISNVNHIIKLE